TLLGLLELIKNGNVCFLDPGSTKFPDACLQAYADAGIRVVIGECVIDRDSPLALPRYPTAEAVARTAAFVKKWDGRLAGRMRAWAMPFSAETCTPELIAASKRIAGATGNGLTRHHSSAASARKDSQAKHGTTPTGYLEKIGALGGNVVLAHVLGIGDDEIEV